MSQPTIFDYLQRAEQPQTAGTIYDQPIMGPLFKWGGWPQVERTEDPWTRDRKQGRLWEQAHGSPWNAREQLGPIQSKVADFLESPGGSALMMMANFIGPGFKPGMRAPVAAQSSPTEGIRAYHGSPHKFDKFSMDKIGSGEGAQAYGHGLYFAENEGVARGYRDALSANSPATVGNSMGAQLLAKHGGANAAIEYIKTLPNWQNNQSMKDAVAYLQGGGARPAGHLYEVNIKAHPDQFLDWDKPLSQQSEAVRKAAAGLPQSEMLSRGPNGEWVNAPVLAREGEAFYSALSEALGKTHSDSRAASQRLREAGVAGIVYDDAGSRGAADGPKTRNRVVFDDSIVEILRRYGLAGLMAGLGGAAANQAEAKP